ncbi:MAG: histidine phosphatase family protein [Anaplasmataceae bacterium]|nr:histidine phosphatase family protein [Anaplasmataceae bacterium]
MKIYFIRHGESEDNAKKIAQGEDGGLSEEGKKQAQFVAERFKKINFDFILSSEYQRAQETAHYIKEATGKDIHATPLLGERRHPSAIIGKHVDDPEHHEIRDLIWENYHLENWRHSDEENFFDLRRRALDFFEYLQQFEEKDILAVTHGFFLRIIVATMMLGENLDPKTFIPIAHFLQTKNTGITLCEKKKERWHLLTWNDHAHLG